MAICVPLRRRRRDVGGKFAGSITRWARRDKPPHWAHRTLPVSCARGIVPLTRRQGAEKVLRRMNLRADQDAAMAAESAPLTATVPLAGSAPDSARQAATA